MADLKPDRVRAAELAQTGAGRGRARGEQAEREHESTRTLLEHDPDFITRGPGRGVAHRGCNAHKVTRLQLRRVGGSATIEEVNRDDTDDGLAPRLRSH